MLFFISYKCVYSIFQTSLRGDTSFLRAREASLSRLFSRKPNGSADVLTGSLLSAGFLRRKVLNNITWYKLSMGNKEQFDRVLKHIFGKLYFEIIYSIDYNLSLTVHLLQIGDVHKWDIKRTPIKSIIISTSSTCWMSPHPNTPLSGIVLAIQYIEWLILNDVYEHYKHKLLPYDMFHKMLAQYFSLVVWCWFYQFVRFPHDLFAFTRLPVNDCMLSNLLCLSKRISVVNFQN